MGDKSLQKRKYIVEKSRSVFFKNGYRAVTMKDIVEACDISRGGLYLYFTNTRDLFEAVLADENEASVAELIRRAREDGSNPGEIMLMYLDEQKKRMLQKKENLITATYEYMFENKSQNRGSFVQKQFDEQVAVLESLIQDGIEQEWMVCEDAAEAALNICYTIEGLKVSARTMGLTAEAVDKEIEYIMGTLGMVIKG